MRVVSALTLSILLLTAALLIMSVHSEPSTIVVPDDYPTIMEAISHAVSGDTVFLRNGTYYEQVLIDKSVSLVGENKAGTIINGSTSDVIVHVIGDFVEITNLTIASTLESWIANPLCVHLDGSQNSVVSDNIISTCGSPIQLSNSDKNRISGNLITGAYLLHAINLVDSDSNTITRNLKNVVTDVSLDLYRSNDNFVSMNEFDGNMATAVFIIESNRNMFTGNNIISPVMPGISIQNSNGTKAYHNYIEGRDWIGNPSDVSIDENSHFSSWDNGYPCGGNSWYGFDGPDDNSGKLQSLPGSDGIIDTPYVVSSDSQDNYPFKQTAGWANQPISIASNVTITESCVKTYVALITTAGDAGGTGAFNVSMPKLNSTKIRVQIDGEPVPDPFPLEIDNGTHYSVYFEFPTGVHEISFQYAGSGDANADGTVNILDIVMVAVSFGTLIPDHNWTLDADVNNDHKVNIIDIATVAIHFGSTE